jgi:hypothetical protein
MDHDLRLKELQPGARALLRRGRWPKELVEQEEQIAGPCPWRAPDLESLLDRFRQLRDGRKGHGLRHRQPFVLACTADAMHCQQESARITTQELGWDYLFGLKGNQSGVLDRAERLLQQQAFPP